MSEMDTLWNSTGSFVKVLKSFMLLIRTIIKKPLRLNLAVVLKRTICAKCMSNTNCAPLEYLCFLKHSQKYVQIFFCISSHLNTE